MDLEAPLLSNQHEVEGAALRGWEQGGEEASGGREIMWQHGEKACGRAAQTYDSDSDGEGAALMGEHEDNEGKEEQCTLAASAEAQSGAGAESRTDAQGRSKGGQLPSGREKGGRGSILMVGFRLIWHSPFYRKLLLVWIIISMTWEGSQVCAAR